MTSIKQCVIAFDFDDTLATYVSDGWYGREILIAIPKFVDLLKEYHALGCQCLVLTARTPSDHHIEEIEQFLDNHGLTGMVSDIVFTSHEPKGPFAEALGVNLHYDDSEKHLESVRSYGIQAVSSV